MIDDFSSFSTCSCLFSVSDYVCVSIDIRKLCVHIQQASKHSRSPLSLHDEDILQIKEGRWIIFHFLILCFVFDTKAFLSPLETTRVLKFEQSTKRQFFIK